jgi:hypothetical protein
VSYDRRMLRAIICALVLAPFSAAAVVACQPASTPTNSGNYGSPSSGEPADPNQISTEQGGPAGGLAAPPPPPQGSALPPAYAPR